MEGVEVEHTQLPKHFTNALLPKAEREVVELKSTQSLAEIKSGLAKLLRFECAETYSVLPTTIFTIKKHLESKFTLTTGERAHAASVLLATYTHPTFNSGISSLPVGVKTSCLEAVGKLLKKTKYEVCILSTFGASSVPYWRLLWDEAVSITTRTRVALQLPSVQGQGEDGGEEEGGGSTAVGAGGGATGSTSILTVGNETLMLQLMLQLVNLTHSLRHHYQLMDSSRSGGSAGNLMDSLSGPEKTELFTTLAVDKQKNSVAMVDECMHALLGSGGMDSDGENLKAVQCVEALFMMVTCLPTDFAHYGEYLPQWVALWTSQQRNTTWDCCWLTLFTRARKFLQPSSTSAAPDVVGQFHSLYCNSILPTLYIKLRHWLKLPGVAAGDVKTGGGAGAGGGTALQGGTEYPFGIPAYYTRLMVVASDLNNACVRKATKLVYFCVSVVLAPAPLGAPPSCAGTVDTIAAGPSFATSPDMKLMYTAYKQSQPAMSTPAAAPVTPAAISLPSSPSITAIINSTPAVLLAQHAYPGLTESAQVTPLVAKFTEFLQSIRNYFYPSNTGVWTAHLVHFVGSFVREITLHMARITSVKQFYSEGSVSDGRVGACAHIPLLDSMARSPQHLTLMAQNIKFLCGHWLPLLLEGLYGKSPQGVQVATGCLRSMCIADPNLGSIVLHSVVKSLDIDAVNQAHQAPAALNAIGAIFRACYTPKPVVLIHLKRILELSLGGIDPNDPVKCQSTCISYFSIFSFLPVKASYSVRDFLPTQGENADADDFELPCVDRIMSYASTSEGADADTTVATRATYKQWEREFAPFVAELNDFMPQFVEKFLDKIILLLEGREKRPTKTGGKNNSASKQADNATAFSSAAVSEFFYSFAASASTSPATTASTKTLELFMAMVTKLLDYTSTQAASSSSIAVNALKDWCSVCESMVALDAIRRVDHVFSKIMERFLLLERGAGSCMTISAANLDSLVKYSPEKLAFTLRMVGSACKGVTSQLLLPYVDLITDNFLKNEMLIQHEEKCVRIAVGKLARDMLRGLSTGTCACSRPAVRGGVLQLKSHPTLVSDQGISDFADKIWSVPTAAAFSTTARVLQATGGVVMSTIEERIANLLTTSAASGGSSNKKVMDAIVNEMHFLRRLLRGAAEAMGNDDDDVDDAVVGDNRDIFEEDSEHIDEITMESEVAEQEVMDGSACADMTSSTAPSTSPDSISPTGSHQPWIPKRPVNPNLRALSMAKTASDSGSTVHISAKELQYLSGFRLRVFRFLEKIASIVFYPHNFQTSAASTQGHPLQNNHSFWKVWCKMLTVSSLYHAAADRAPKNMKGGLNFISSLFGSPFDKLMGRMFKCAAARDKALPTATLVTDWKYKVCNRAGLLLVVKITYQRSKLLCSDANAAMKYFMHRKRTADGGVSNNPHWYLFQRLFRGIVLHKLCCHNYDDVRVAGLTLIQAVSPVLPSSFFYGMVGQLADNLCRESIPDRLLKGAKSPPAAGSTGAMDVAEEPSNASSTALATDDVDIYYATAVASTFILTTDRVLRRVLRRRDLVLRLQYAVLHSRRMIQQCIKQQDKQALVESRVAQLFVRFSESWYEVSDGWNRWQEGMRRGWRGCAGSEAGAGGAAGSPRLTQEKVLRDALALCGYREKAQDGQESNAVNAASAASSETPSSASEGLRSQIFATFVILRTSGYLVNRDLAPEMCKHQQLIQSWLLQLLLQENKPVELQQSSEEEAGVTSVSAIPPPKAIASLPLPLKQQVVTIVRKMSATEPTWLLRGLSATSSASTLDAYTTIMQLVHEAHTRNAEMSSGAQVAAAQWSYGISNIVNASEYSSRCNVTRKESGCEYDGVHYSLSVKNANMRMWKHLFQAELEKFEANGDRVGAVQWVKCILALISTKSSAATSRSTPEGTQSPSGVSSAVRVSSQDEETAFNYLFAEVFAALGRAIKDMQHRNSAELMTLLAAFFAKQVDKLSLSYTKDWAAAVFYIYLSAPVPNQVAGADALKEHIVATFRKVMRCSGGDVGSAMSVTAASANGSSSGAAEGFTQEAKELVVCAAALTGSHVACRNARFYAMAAAVADKATAPPNLEHSKNLLAKQFQEVLKLSAATAAAARGSDSVATHPLASPHRTTREELASILSILLEDSNTVALGGSTGLKVAPISQDDGWAGALLGHFYAQLRSVAAVVTNSFSSVTTAGAGAGAGAGADDNIGGTTVSGSADLKICMDKGAVGSYFETGKFVVSAVSAGKDTGTTSLSQQEQQAVFKSVVDMNSRFLYQLIREVNQSQFDSTLLPHMLNISFIGVGCVAFDAVCSTESSKVATLVCNNAKFFANASTSAGDSNNGNQVKLLTALMRVCEMHMLRSAGSIHIRKTAIACYLALFTNHHQLLSNDEKKVFKNTLYSCIGIGTGTGSATTNSTAGLLLTPDIYLLVQYGTMLYLTIKSPVELATLASGYIKNCTLLYDRLRKQRRAANAAAALAAGDGNSGKDVYAVPVDNTLLTTVVTSCCMVLLCPVDVPSYAPPLLTALVQFLSISSSSSAGTAVDSSTGSSMNFNVLKDIVKKVVAEFKRTHQDRYTDAAFKAQFTTEQWDDLQGAGSSASASYFS